MFYVLMQAGRAVSTTTEYPEKNGGYNRDYQNRNDWRSLEEVERIAQELTEATGTLYVGVDSGPNVSPRYDVVEAPVVGAEVSRGFNGDYYPEGTITKVSKSLRRVETSTGAVFFRRKQSATWSDGTFSMVRGHINERNPSF